MKKQDKKVYLLLIILIVVVIGGIFLLNQKKKSIEQKKMLDEKNQQEMINELIKDENTENIETQIRYQCEKIYEYTGDGGDFTWIVNGKPSLLVGSDKLMQISMIDGNVLFEKENNGYPPQDYFPWFYTLDCSGGIWLTGWGQQENGPVVFEFNEDTKIFEQKAVLHPSEELAEQGIMMTKAVVDDNGVSMIYESLQDDGDKHFLEIYDWSGKPVYQEEDVLDMDIAESDRFIVAKNGLVECLERKDELFSQKWKAEITGRAIKVNCEVESRQIAITTPDEIFLMDMDGKKEPKSIFQFQKDTFYIPQNATLVNGCIDTDCNIYLQYWEFGKTENDPIQKKIYRFTPYEVEAGDEKIVISMPYPLEIVNLAAERYESLYPGRSVVIDAAYSSEEEFEKNKEVYVEQMTARLLTGDYGDILWSSRSVYSSDVLTTDSFMDVSDWIKNTNNYENLNQNILKAQEADGKLRCVPVATSFDYWIGNKELVEEADHNQDGSLTWSELLDQMRIWEKTENKDYYLFGEDYSLYSIVGANIYDLVDPEEKKIDLRQEWFLSLLEKWKDVKQAGLDVSPTEVFDITEGKNTSDAFHAGILFQKEITENRIAEYPDMGMEASWYYENQEDSGITFCMLPCIAGEKHRNVYAYPKYGFSVNNTSDEKEAALDFLEVMLSDEVQDRLEYGLVPLSRTAYENQYELALDNSNDPTYQENVKNFYEQTTVIFDQVDWMYSYLYAGDLIDALCAYESGKMTLDEALDEAEKKIWIRMNE